MLVCNNQCVQFKTCLERMISGWRTSVIIHVPLGHVARALWLCPDVDDICLGRGKEESCGVDDELHTVFFYKSSSTFLFLLMYLKFRRLVSGLGDVV